MLARHSFERFTALPATPASSAILERDGRYLLVRRANPPAADMYAFPGGRGEPGETPEDTAIRECAEETGLAVARPRLFATYGLESFGEDGTLQSHYFLSVFLVESCDDAEAVAADDAAELGWYNAAEIRRMRVPDSVLECIERLERAAA